MLGAGVRNRVKQSALVVSASEFNFTGGTASAGFRLFSTAYTEEFYHIGVPVLIETEEDGTGSWMTGIGIYHKVTGSTDRLYSFSFYDSSTGSILAPAVDSTVYISVVPLSQNFSFFAVRAGANTQGTTQTANESAYLAGTGGTGLLAVGQAAWATGTDAVAIGRYVLSNNVYSFGTGYRTATPAGAMGRSTNYWAASGLFTTYNGSVSRFQRDMACLTTDATPTNFDHFINGSALTAVNHQIGAGLYTFDCLVHAVSTTGLRKIIRYKFSAKSNANASGTALVGTPSLTTEFEDTGTETWTVEASYTSGTSIQFKATGEAGVNILWGCAMDTLYTKLAS